MNLHAKILNLPDEADPRDGGQFACGYKNGHRAARHAAAELALEASRRIDALAEALVDMTAGMKDHDIAAHTGMAQGDCERLAEVRAWALAHQRARAAEVADVV